MTDNRLEIEKMEVCREGQKIRLQKIYQDMVAARAVAQARARKGLSQKELAVLSGVDQSDISKIERGIANPSVSTLNRLAQAMELQLKIAIE